MAHPLPEIQKLPPSQLPPEKSTEGRVHAMNGMVTGFVVIAILAVIGGVLFVRFPSLFLSFFIEQKGEVLQDDVIGDLALAREISALGSPVTPVSGFVVADKKYFLALRMENAPPETEIAVRWYEGSVLIGETAKRVSGYGWVPFSFSPAAAHPTTYRLEIYRDGLRKTSVLFSVLP